MNGKNYIIYPAGDQTKLQVLFLADSMFYELSDYVLASRQSFNDSKEAIEYAKKLAKENNKIYMPDRFSDDDDERNNYLD